METNKELLDQVIEQSLMDVQDHEVCSEPHKAAFKEAMEAYDRRIELEKIEEKQRELALREKDMELKERELANKEKSEKGNKVLKYIEIIAVPVGLLTLDYVFKRSFMKDVCNFEKDYTFTTTPGRSISSLFKWKK